MLTKYKLKTLYQEKYSRYPFKGCIIPDQIQSLINALLLLIAEFTYNVLRGEKTPAINQIRQNNLITKLAVSPFNRLLTLAIKNSE